MPVDAPIWWDVLRLVVIANMLAWWVSALMLAKRAGKIPAGIYRTRRLGLWLSMIYVLGCGFRSFFPVADVPRICLIDSWLSSVVLGRSIATVAEMALIAQCVLLLYEAGKAADARLTVIVSCLLLPVIAVAELSSWYAVITTNYAGAVVEESLWTLTALLMTAGVVAIQPRVSDALRPFMVMTLIFSVGYVTFMLGVDIPMYFVRMQQDIAVGRDYLSLAPGLMDAAGACHVSSDWNVWRDELKWLMPYFTVAVWFSIALTHTPWPIAHNKT